MPERHRAVTDPRPPVFVSTMTSDRFEVFHSFVHVEDGLRLHTHDHYEINCILNCHDCFRILHRYFKFVLNVIDNLE